MTSAASKSAETTVTQIIAVNWDNVNWNFSLAVSGWLVLVIAIVLIVGLVWRASFGSFFLKNMEIDQADFGLGDQKISLRPNSTDRQVAYAIWVELSTRKIGLPIDFEDDVIEEIYDSWFSFFTVTRELVKSVPVQKVRRDSTQKIVKLSIEVLNQGLRPHLTKWQARFRHWYDRELKRYDEGRGEEVLDPQLIQKKFPKYQELIEDMGKVNERLINYRLQMHRLVLKD